MFVFADIGLVNLLLFIFSNYFIILIISFKIDVYWLQILIISLYLLFDKKISWDLKEFDNIIFGINFYKS